MDVLLLAAGLVAYNGLVNLWPPFQGRLYVPLNLATTGVVLVAGFVAFDLSSSAIGLRWRGAAAGAVIAVAAAVPLFLSLSHPRGARLLADGRLGGLGRGDAAFMVLVRIPMGTAVLEEVAFRGVLYAAAGSDADAAVLSSVAFGLWHVTPTIALVRANRPGARAAALVVAVAAGVVVTGLAGVFLVWLRERSGGIAAPLALHAGLNSLAALSALLAHRIARVRPAPLG